MAKRFPWKGSFRRIPDWLVGKVKKQSGDLVVACLKKVPVSHLRTGRYDHVGIGVQQNAPTSSPRIVPARSNGRFSRLNLDGREIIRTDLPMATRTYSWETPNWGDWGKGSHTTDYSRLVYQREFDPPRGLALSIEFLAMEHAPSEPLAVFRFAVDQVLRRTDQGFREELLFALNLLQENVGQVDVFPASASREDYLKTIYVHWEILPPGERDATMAQVLSGLKGSREELRKRLADRYDLLVKLKPNAFISGTSGFQRYFGARFADDMVVFENLEYGNAVYVMGEQWETLSQLSRIDLLRGDRKGFVRIVHRTGWKDRLRRVIRETRKTKISV